MFTIQLCLYKLELRILRYLFNICLIFYVLLYITYRSTSRLDIIQLIPINENFEKTCSSAVLIQTITRDPTRNTAIVLAEDVNTGLFLRCDVIVDAIFSLNLVTTTRELYIEEAPEAFEVRAYDDQGDIIITCEKIYIILTSE